jgi:hypothetical protein
MADKGAVFLKNADLFKILEAASHQKARKFFERVEDLRNSLAHSQDIMSENWPGLGDLLVEIENILRRMEKAWFLIGRCLIESTSFEPAPPSVWRLSPAWPSRCMFNTGANEVNQVYLTFTGCQAA